MQVGHPHLGITLEDVIPIAKPTGEQAAIDARSAKGPGVSGGEDLEAIPIGALHVAPVAKGTCRWAIIQPE